MNDSDPNPLSDLLGQFALGPAWARSSASDDTARERKYKDRFKDDSRGPRRDGRRDGPGGFQGGGKNFRDRRDTKGRDFTPRPEPANPESGVRVTILPSQAAVHLIGKEIHSVARVYSLYDIAETLMARRDRCIARFEANSKHAPLLKSKLDDALFLTREEAARHIAESHLRGQLLDEETIEVDPPAGNFQSVAKCGLSGEWLGPPNFHTYQSNIRRLHRERFSHLPFAAYQSKITTEKGEEAVNSWLETMKHKKRWRVKGDADDAWIDDPAELQRVIGTRLLDLAFEECHTAEINGDAPARHLSPTLLASLKAAAKHVRFHPAILIPAVCRAIETEHLPVFKRKGKLFTGPARPHPLPKDVSLAARPAVIVNWIRANPPAKLEGLWKAVLPEGSTAPPAEFAADLFWLLTQGHILLFPDDTLVVQELHDPPPAKKRAADKKAGATEPEESAEAPAEPSSKPNDPAIDPPDADVAPLCEGPTCEAPEPPAPEPPMVTAPELPSIMQENPSISPLAIDEPPCT